jgi:hypothetical protein
MSIICVQYNKLYLLVAVNCIDINPMKYKNRVSGIEAASGAVAAFCSYRTPSDGFRNCFCFFRSHINANHLRRNGNACK